MKDNDSRSQSQSYEQGHCIRAKEKQTDAAKKNDPFDAFPLRYLFDTARRDTCPSYCVYLSQTQFDFSYAGIRNTKRQSQVHVQFCLHTRQRSSGDNKRLFTAMRCIMALFWSPLGLKMPSSRDMTGLDVTMCPGNPWLTFHSDN